jgi:hypothetical protein
MPRTKAERAALAGWEQDLHELIDAFATQVGAGAPVRLTRGGAWGSIRAAPRSLQVLAGSRDCTLDAFKQLWRELSFSYIHQVRPLPPPAPAPAAA